MKRETMFSEHLVRLKDAPSEVNRSKRTVYRWIAQGRLEVIRPGREKYLIRSELLRVEAETGGRGLR